MPRHPQAFLPTATQHHSGLIHVDEDSCLVPNGPSRFGPLQVPCCLTTGSNHWTKNTRRNPKTVQILGPVLRSIFGPQNGPQVGCLIKNPIEARFRGPFLGPFLGPKIGTRNRPKNADEFSQKLGKTLTRRDPGIQQKKKDLQKPANATWTPLQV